MRHSLLAAPVVALTLAAVAGSPALAQEEPSLPIDLTEYTCAMYAQASDYDQLKVTLFLAGYLNHLWSADDEYSNLIIDGDRVPWMRAYFRQHCDGNPSGRLVGAFDL